MDRVEKLEKDLLAAIRLFGEKAIDAEMRLQVLESMLMDKGLVTVEELSETHTIVTDSEFEKERDKLFENFTKYSEGRC